MSALLPGKCIAVDTETTSLNPFANAINPPGRPFAVGFCDEHGNIEVFHWEVCRHTRQVKYDASDLEWIRRQLHSADHSFVYHNIWFDAMMLASIGVFPPIKHCFNNWQQYHDTLIGASVINNLELNRGLKPLSQKYCGYGKEDEKDLKSNIVKARNALRKENRLYEKEGLPAPNLLYEKTGAKGDGATKGDMCFADWALVERYLIGDVERTMLLHTVQMEAINKDPSKRAYYDRERELIWAYFRMQWRGVRTFKEALASKAGKYEKLVSQWESNVYQIAGKPFKINSSQQMQEILYDKIGLEKRYSRKTGNVTTQWKYLKGEKHPIIRAISKYKSYGKACNDCHLYAVNAVPDGDDYFTHPQWQQIEADTGRSSCRAPNMQNVTDSESSHNPDTVQARDSFGPRRGKVWWLLDWSQQEALIFASYAEQDTDPAISPMSHELLKPDGDIHTMTANLVWASNLDFQAQLLGIPRDLPPGKRAFEKHAPKLRLHCDELHDGKDKANKAFESVLYLYEKYGYDPHKLYDLWLEELTMYDLVKAESLILGSKRARYYAKSILYQLLYGGGVNALSDAVGCSKDEAFEYRNNYFANLPSIPRHINKLQRLAKEQGYIETAIGRKIYIDPNAPYKATNYQIQGSGADQKKRALLHIEKLCYQYPEFEAEVILDVHDELVIEMRKSRNTHFIPQGDGTKKIKPLGKAAMFLRSIKKIMEYQMFRLPIGVGCEYVDRLWSQKTKVIL